MLLKPCASESCLCFLIHMATPMMTITRPPIISICFEYSSKRFEIRLYAKSAIAAKTVSEAMAPLAQAIPAFLP